ncbi:hypothetical protein JCM11251_002739 [Rhodosporidiobolus azoricus]
MATQRPLGLYERFSLARTQAGVPPIVTLTAELPSAVSVDNIRIAVGTLLRRYPLLRCSIADRATSTPRFFLRDETTAAEIAEESDTGSVQAALTAALAFGEAKTGAFNLDTGPLWRIWVAKAGHRQTRITLLVSHIVSDGASAKSLFAELLTLLRTPVKVEEPKQDAIAPSLEETLDTALGVLGMAKVVFTKVLLPALPSFLRPAPTSPVYLATALTPPLLRPSVFKYFSLPSSVVSGLKSAGKSNGVDTLHPVLYQSAFAALAAIIALDGLPPFTLTGSTPYSLRDPTLHPSLTGNYVAGLDTSSTVSSLLPSRFWAVTADYGKHLNDPATKLAATKRMGMLSLLPSGELPMTGDKLARTKWEEWVTEQGEKGKYDQTFELSNLGVLPATGWEEEGLEEVTWVRPGAVMGAAIQISPIAVRGGHLSFTASYRQNAVDEATIDRFWTAYKDILLRISEGAVGDAATFGEIVRMLA